MHTIIVGCLATVGMLFLGHGTALAGESPAPFMAGTARVTALQDMPGAMSLDIFRGADMKEMRTLVPSGSAPAGVTVFLIRHDGKNIIVDTGYGGNVPGQKSALPELLRSVGTDMGDIDAVLLTHMHGDHVGGLVAGGAAAFPKAVVMVNEKELAFWTDPKTLREKPGLDSNVQMVKNMQKAYGDKVKIFTFDDEVLSGVTALGGTGHTPGHTLFLLTSGADRILFWGDLVHAAALQFANPNICATYDMNMPEAAATRREVFAKAAEEKIPVAGAHLPYPALGRVTREGGGTGYTFTPGL